MIEIKQVKLTIEIPIEIHSKLKAYAALRNITMRLYILRFIIEGMNKEKIKFEEGNS
jgi:hypothetical protein